MATIFAFVKLFENENYANDFMKGKLFMNTIRYFKEYRDESGKLRGDNYEGIVSLLQPKLLGEIVIADRSIPASELTAPIVLHSNGLLANNVFCIYSLNSRGHDSVSAETVAEFHRTLELHESCFGLGKYCVVILDAEEFRLRCSKAVKELNFDASHGLVDYFDEHTFHGNMAQDRLGFQKRNFFNPQREYRIKIDTRAENPGPYVMEIGDLSDIAKITTPNEFNEQLEIKLPSEPTP